MQKPRIRLGRREDAESIERMISEWSKSQWPKWRPKRTETILEALKDERNHLLLVSETSSEIIGVLHLIFYLDILHGASNCHVNFLLIKEGYRDKGVGSSLLDDAAKYAKKRGANEMHVDTIFKEAAEFYRKYGFKDDGAWLEFSLQEEPKEVSITST